MDKMIIKEWNIPSTVTRNNFIYKSLSDWACNMAVGCAHKCRFCYTPAVSVGKGLMKEKIQGLGVDDPDADWGEYVFPRLWDDAVFLHSVLKAERTPIDKLSKDGNRAIMFSTTTDFYQTTPNKEFNDTMRKAGREALTIIRDHSTLNVRILTRSPLARVDFDLMRSFGPRLMFGMSLPTLSNKLASIYEPGAPAPSKRLETLQAARDAGLNVYVAVAPVYPECDATDMLATLKAVKALEPHTIFMEPINIRAENVERIRKYAESKGVFTNTQVFATNSAWGEYAINQLDTFESLVEEEGVHDRLHLWPDQGLKKYAKTPERVEWLNKWWHRVSEWPN